MNKSLINELEEVNWGSGKAVLVGFMEALLSDFQQHLEAKIQAHLEGETEALLGREAHQRRRGCGYRRGSAVCRKCGSRRRRDFWRNGHRRRQLQTSLGEIEVWYPRVVCECGGSVELPLSLVGRYQRFWDDMDAQVRQYAQWGLSLRQMQASLSDMLSSSVGLRRLNECVQAVRQPLATELTSVPPILLLDAIWITLLCPTGEMRPDRKGRQRAVKRKHKVALLVALGVWPSGNWQVLDWELASGEDYPSWEGLLVRLEARGLYRERGLHLIVHDGNAALTAVLRQMYPHIPHQRCLFHKLRNLWRAIALPLNIGKDEAVALKREFMRQLRAIFYAPTQIEAQRRRDVFCTQWASSQPALVATLCRDWDDSVAFYRVLLAFPHWPRQRLRTTSLLERVNRSLRRLFRAAGAFHSHAGLLAAAARILNPLRAI